MIKVLVNYYASGKSDNNLQEDISDFIEMKIIISKNYFYVY